MTRFVVRRLAQNVVLLLAMSVVVFGLLHVAPNSPFSELDNPEQTAEDVARLRANYGLDQPLPVQYLAWAGRVLQGDLGRSFLSKEPVARVVAERLPATLLLAGSALALSLLIGVPLGIYAALHRGAWSDNLIRVVTVVLDALPNFWLGLMAVVVLGGLLGWFPQGGMYSLARRDEFDVVDRLRHLFLPAVVLATGGWVAMSRLMRSETLEVLGQDFVRTARAKGLRERVVLYRHVLRNASLPLVTTASAILPALFSGAALTEIVFSWPGMGRLTLEAALKRDFPVILATWLIASVLILVGRMLSDVLYAVVDPRVRLS